MYAKKVVTTIIEVGHFRSIFLEFHPTESSRRVEKFKIELLHNPGATWLIVQINPVQCDSCIIFPHHKEKSSPRSHFKSPSHIYETSSSRFMITIHWEGTVWRPATCFTVLRIETVKLNLWGLKFLISGESAVDFKQQ